MADVSKEMAARMEAFKVYGTPGPEHRKLDPLVGTWRAAVRSWLVPGGQPMESSGTTAFRWILEGRHLIQDFHGDMGGQPFEGQALFGYDKYKKTYWTTWIDSSSTAILLMTGGFDSSGNTLTTSGPWTDPVTGKTGTFRQVLRFGKDRIDCELFAPDASGRESRMLEIAYTKG